MLIVNHLLPSKRIIKKGFSLIEVMVALTVFALVITAAGGTFASIQQAWKRQSATLDLVNNSRWAMEFMVNEIRGAGNFNIVSAERVQFELPPGGPSNRVWYWRGDGGSYGSRSTIFRGRGAGLGNANLNRQELANLIADNPGGSNIFNLNIGVVTLELTVKKGNSSYTLRSQARPRN